MDEFLPQEIEVRYIIPALRGALAKSFIDQGLSQKKAAELLGLSEGAISQYLHGKRGGEVEFSKPIQHEITKTAQEIINSKNPKQDMIQALYKLSKMTSIKKVMCDMHRKSSKELQDCTICFDSSEIKVRI